MLHPTLILASNSPRRREMLSWTGFSFLLRPVDIDESPLPGELPPAYVMRLAQEKATCAAKWVPDSAIILAADTTVADAGFILGKPGSAGGAAAMLRRLRGRTHQVHTAITVLLPADDKMEHDLCTSNVAMRCYTDEEMTAYIASGDPLDKAGAYAIQNSKFHPVIDFKGCYASVAGLPLCHLQRTLQNFNIPPAGDIPAACRCYFGYDCPIFARVQQGLVAG